MVRSTKVKEFVLLVLALFLSGCARSRTGQVFWLSLKEQPVPMAAAEVFLVTDSDVLLAQAKRARDKEQERIAAEIATKAAAITLMIDERSRTRLERQECKARYDAACAKLGPKAPTYSGSVARTGSASVQAWMKLIDEWKSGTSREQLDSFDSTITEQSAAIAASEAALKNLGLMSEVRILNAMVASVNSALGEKPAAVTDSEGRFVMKSHSSPVVAVRSRQEDRFWLVDSQLMPEVLILSVENSAFSLAKENLLAKLRSPANSRQQTANRMPSAPGPS